MCASGEHREHTQSHTLVILCGGGGGGVSDNDSDDTSRKKGSCQFKWVFMFGIFGIFGVCVAERWVRVRYHITLLFYFYFCCCCCRFFPFVRFSFVSFHRWGEFGRMTIVEWTACHDNSSAHFVVHIVCTSFGDRLLACIWYLALGLQLHTEALIIGICCVRMLEDNLILYFFGMICSERRKQQTREYYILFFFRITFAHNGSIK